MDKKTGFGIGAGIIAGVIGTIVIYSYYRETRRPEPAHIRFSQNYTESIKKSFLNRGFEELWPPSEVRKVDEIWGVAKYLPDNKRQMHVRAFKDSTMQAGIYLSAHVEPRRDRLEHFRGNADNNLGKKLLLEFLRDEGFMHGIM